MNRSVLLAVAATALALVASGPVSAQSPGAAPSADSARSPESTVLERALNNMSRLRGYHVDAVITTPVGKAKVSGDLAEGALSLAVTDPKGNTKLRVLVDKQFYLSTDGGRTWKTGKEAESNFTVFFSTLLTSPIEPRPEVWTKGNFSGREETVGGETLVHLEKPAQGKEVAVNFWLCKEPELSNQVFVRRLTMTVAASDGNFPLDVTYSRLTKTVSIKAPTSK